VNQPQDDSGTPDASGDEDPAVAEARELARQVDRRIHALSSKNRAARLKAAHRLGRDLERRAAPGAPIPVADDPGPSADQVARALVGLERLALDPDEGAWVRKRARRAIRKIRGEGEENGEGEDDEFGMEPNGETDVAGEPSD
jgi:hypothetical protein